MTEFKYLTGQAHAKTSIVYEFPKSHGDAYYPVPRAENTELYAKYRELADATPKVHFVGRLATYKYYNMDQIMAQALTIYARMISASRKDAVALGSVHTVSGNRQRAAKGETAGGGRAPLLPREFAEVKSTHGA